jgi:hypothetical protein
VVAAERRLDHWRHTVGPTVIGLTMFAVLFFLLVAAQLGGWLPPEG